MIDASVMPVLRGPDRLQLGEQSDRPPRWDDTARLRERLGAIVAHSRQRSTLWQRTIALNSGLSAMLL